MLFVVMAATYQGPTVAQVVTIYRYAIWSCNRKAFHAVDLYALIFHYMSRLQTLPWHTWGAGDIFESDSFLKHIVFY